MKVKWKGIMLVIFCLVISRQAEAQATYDATGTWTYSTSNNWVNPGTAGCTVEANETVTVTITQSGTTVEVVIKGETYTGTVTSVDLSVPSGLSVSGNPVTSSGTLAVSYAAGYAIPTTTKQSNWDDAYTFTGNFPTQTGHSGEYLTTDGSSLSWSAVDALPDQTGNAGKYLTTDGTDASWATLDTDANTTTKGLYEMANTISSNYTISSGNNAMSAGPITINSGVTVTVPTGSRWVVV